MISYNILGYSILKSWAPGTQGEPLVLPYVSDTTCLTCLLVTLNIDLHTLKVKLC